MEAAAAQPVVADGTQKTKKKKEQPAIVHCKSDPHGVRAAKDYHDHKACPLGLILASQNEIPMSAEEKDQFDTMKKELPNLVDELTKEVRAVEEAAKRPANMSVDESNARDNGIRKTVHEILEKRLAGSKGEKLHGFKETQDALKGLTGENLLLAEKLVICTDMLEQLNKQAALRRMIFTKRIVDPSQKQIKTSMKIKAWYLIVPMLLFMVCFGFQSFLLHVATHFYVYYMEAGPPARRHSGGQLYDLIGNYVGSLVLSQNHNVTEEGAVIEGNVDVPLTALDISGAVPLAMCVAAYVLAMWQHSFNIGLWNKTFLVASIMAVLKGVFDAVTILPDSIGWDDCKERLGEAGLETIRQLDWTQKSFFSTLGRAVFEELLGGSDHKRVRYCADMMISGHTYFACLFALSAYKQFAYITDVIPGGCINRTVRRSVGVLCIVCIATEMVLVAIARFHYTVDMISAAVLVVLLWDSTHVEQLAADWSEGFDWYDKTFKPQMAPIFFFCLHGFNVPSDEGVLPSASTCTNHRTLKGHPPWLESEDVDDADATEAKTADDRSTARTLPPQGGRNEAKRVEASSGSGTAASTEPLLDEEKGRVQPASTM
eukprot:gb/GFBE01067432.1/.p1 GENE.gb/GFBE01067432.1/~~gb/GFBE01067432.1/.p1  ORF type:complete len:601 (+),score=109.87 gb/GFBE01067432.1/:1-1803(+)